MMGQFGGWRKFDSKFSHLAQHTSVTDEQMTLHVPHLHQCHTVSHTHTPTHTHTTVLRPFVRDYPGEPVPEETLTHPPSSSSNLYQLLPSTTIHSILPLQITCLAIFLHNLIPCPLVYLLVWSPPPHIPYISSPNQCLLFAAHAHSIATCFAVASVSYHLFLVFLLTLWLAIALPTNSCLASAGVAAGPYLYVSMSVGSAGSPAVASQRVNTRVVRSKMLASRSWHFRFHFHFQLYPALACIV